MVISVIELILRMLIPKFEISHPTSENERSEYCEFGVNFWSDEAKLKCIEKILRSEMALSQ